MIQAHRAMDRNLMTYSFFSLGYSRKPRRKDPITSNNNPSPPPSDPNNVGLVNTHENSHPSSSSIPSNTSTPIHSSSTTITTSSSNNSTLLYLQPQYAVLTRSLAECNIHGLIDQPRGVDKNEWIANNSTMNHHSLH